MMQNIFEQALHITSPWFIQDLDFNHEEKKLNVYVDFKKGSKFEYITQDGDTELGSVHDTVSKTWRHLNFFEHECFLHVRVPRIKKRDGKVHVAKVPWEGKMNGFTMLFEALLLQLCTAMPVLKVSQLTGVSDDKIWSMLDRYVQQALELMDLSGMKIMGMDETSHAKHHSYITLFVDMVKRKIVYITEGKNHETVKKFVSFLEQHKGNRNNITDVSSDMSSAFIKGISKYLKKAETTFDKFHIVKKINEAVNEVRKNEVTEQELLKGSKYLFLTNKENLSEKQLAKLEKLKMSKLNLKTIKALQMRENFQSIYDSQSFSEFEKKLNDWYFWVTHNKLKPMIKVAKTIKKHWDGILRWYNSRINNGTLEGINSVIQAAKAKARGYKLTKNFKNIAYLLIGDIDLTQINPNFQKLE
ncbi:MAG: ISL3 family transposase [Colwellia sp.]|nr:ISL3 family transposase [Colwellia sp.]